MKEKELNKNREHLLKLLLDKSALKQDVADDCEKVFMSFLKKNQNQFIGSSPNYF